MTNAQIILSTSQRLLQEGKIRPTGNTLVFTDASGARIEMPETEAIHTFNTWKALGYSVRRGEKAIARITIWKYTGPRHQPDTDDDDADENGGRCFLKESCFFSAAQVEPINRTA